MIALRINANYYSFLSGVFIAVSINLYTGIFSSDQVPTRWLFLIISTILTFISAAFWAIISWEIDAIQKLVLVDSPDYVDENELLRKFATEKRFKIVSYFVIAIMSAVLGLIILLLGYDQPILDIGLPIDPTIPPKPLPILPYPTK